MLSYEETKLLLNHHLHNKTYKSNGVDFFIQFKTIKIMTIRIYQEQLSGITITDLMYRREYDS